MNIAQSEQINMIELNYSVTFLWWPIDIDLQCFWLTFTDVCISSIKSAFHTALKRSWGLLNFIQKEIQPSCNSLEREQLPQRSTNWWLIWAEISRRAQWMNRNCQSKLNVKMQSSVQTMISNLQCWLSMKQLKHLRQITVIVWCLWAPKKIQRENYSAMKTISITNDISDILCSTRRSSPTDEFDDQLQIDSKIIQTKSNENGSKKRKRINDADDDEHSRPSKMCTRSTSALLSVANKVSSGNC